MPPAVSIIIPAYNVTAYIRTALDSIVAQTFTDYEIILVNDGCPDTANLERVLDAYRRRIRYLRQENNGVGASRRIAVLAAEAPLIAQLDPDDWWEPDYLQTQLSVWRERNMPDLLYPNGFYFGDPMLEGKRLMDYTPSRGEVSFCRIMDGQVNVIYSALIRRQAILDAGNFDPDLRTSEDFDLWIRILKSGGRIEYHDKPLLHYRRRTDSLTAKERTTQEWFLRVLDKLDKTLPLNADERACLERRKISVRMDMELASGKLAITRGNWKRAREHLERYYAYRPNRKLLAVLMMLRYCPTLLAGGFTLRNQLLKSGILKARRPAGVS